MKVRQSLKKRLICLMAVTILLSILPVPAFAAKALLTSEETAYLKEHPTISVAMDVSWVPYAYVDSQTGEMRGIVHTILEDIGEAVGLNIEYVAKKDYQEALQSVGSGETDLIAGVVQNNSMAAYYNLQLTDSYTVIRYCAVTNQKIEDLYASGAHYSVAVCAASYAAIAMKEKTASNQIVDYHTNQECINAVKNGEADVAFVASYPAEYYMQQPGYSGLISVLADDMAWSLSFGVSERNDPILTRILNKGIASLTEDDINQAIYGNLLDAINDSSNLITLIYRYPMQTVVFVGGLITTIVALGGIFFKKQREQQLKNQRLCQELMIAESSNIAKRDFLSHMSHDIRTPMNAIIGMTELALTEKNDTAAVEDYLAKIKTASQYLLRLINDALDMSRIESGKMVLRTEVISLKEYYQDIDTLIRPLANERKIRFEFENCGINEMYAKIDKMRVQQIVLNLLSNAIKFTPPGGTVKCVISNLSKHNGIRRDRIIIRDNGIGMSEEFMTRLFLPFEQENAIVEPNHSGTGLGLAIVKILVELMNGTISVTSQKGVGTEFVVELESEMVDESIMMKQDQTTTEAFDFSGKRVLLCEDHPINTAIAIKLLEMTNLVVDHVINGKAAVEQYAAKPEQYYNAILMDIQLPVMNGLEAARAIRAMDRTDAATIPIIAMTASALDQDINDCESAGMNAYVSKPIDPSVFFGIIQRMFEGKDKMGVISNQNGTILSKK